MAASIVKLHRTSRFFLLLVDEAVFFRYTYILLWRYGQVVKTSASQAEIEGSIPSSAILAVLSGLLIGRLFCVKTSSLVIIAYLDICLNKANISEQLNRCTAICNKNHPV